MNIAAVHSWILKYCLPWVSNFSLARNYLSNEHHKTQIEAPGHMTVEKMNMHDFGSFCDFQSAVSPLPYLQSFWNFGWTLDKQRSLLTRKIKVKTQSSFLSVDSSRYLTNYFIKAPDNILSLSLSNSVLSISPQIRAPYNIPYSLILSLIQCSLTPCLSPSLNSW